MGESTGNNLVKEMIMTIKKIYSFILLIFFVPFIVGCQLSIPSKKEQSFLEFVHFDHFNQEIQFNQQETLKLPNKIGDDVFLELVDQTESPIIIPLNEIIILTYIKDKNRWSPISNDTSYMASSQIIWPKGKSAFPFPFITFGVNPDFCSIPSIDLQSGTPIDIRIVVFGYIQDKNASPGKRVGAYIDLTMNP
jgi:hypothetical protein